MSFMLQGPSFNMKLLEPKDFPINRWCKSGHYAPDEFKHPISGETIPNRFLYVTGDTLVTERHGVYCEECMAKAWQMAQLDRKLRKISL